MTTYQKIVQAVLIVFDGSMGGFHAYSCLLFVALFAGRVSYLAQIYSAFPVGVLRIVLGAVFIILQYQTFGCRQSGSF